MRRNATRWLCAGLPALIAAMGLVSAAGTARADNDDQGTPWLGVYTQAVTPELRDGLDLRGDGGVLVSRVVADSPAEHAGVRKGDVIVRVGSHEVSTPEELADVVHGLGVNQIVSLQILRNGDRQTLTARLGSRNGDGDEPSAPEAPEAPEVSPVPHLHMHGDQAPTAPDVDRDDHDGDDEGQPGDKVQRFEFHTPDSDSDPGDRHVQRFELRTPDADGTMRGMVMSRGRLGVRVESLSPDLASYFDVPDGRGVLVLEVMRDTPAERAGLRAGDVIMRVDGRDVNNAESLVNTLNDRDGRVTLQIVRKGNRRSIEATLDRSAPRAFRMEGMPRMAPMAPMAPMTPRENLRAPGGEDREQIRRDIERLRREIDELEKKLERD